MQLLFARIQFTRGLAKFYEYVTKSMNLKQSWSSSVTKDDIYKRKAPSLGHKTLAFDRSIFSELT